MLLQSDSHDPNISPLQRGLQVMMQGQDPVSQPPNVVLSGAPPQQDFTGGAGRLAPHRLVVAPAAAQVRAAALPRIWPAITSGTVHVVADLTTTGASA